MPELKPCPFCGEIPYIERKPLWRGSHGYVGRFEYDIHCRKCGCEVPLPGNNTIYNTDDDARKNAVTAWNRRYKEDDNV